jgi:hypothetical protein
MNRIPFSLFATALLCGLVFTQLSEAQQPGQPNSQKPPTQQPPTDPTAPETPAPPPTQTAPPATSNLTSRIAPGTVIPTQLTKTVDAKKAKSGDELIAKVTQDISNAYGAIVVPKNSKIIGHVTQVQARTQPHTKDQKESQLAIVFDKVLLTTGETVEMHMSLQAVVAPAPPNNANAAGAQSGASPASPTASPVSTGLGTRPGTLANSPQAPQPGDDSSVSQPRPPINQKTQGVVGFDHLSLAPAPDADQGSLVTSDKNNVKLEDGTLLLLRVNR